MEPAECRGLPEEALTAKQITIEAGESEDQA